MSQTYFAADGNYGNAIDLVVVDTEDFTELDWQAIDEAGDSERNEVALLISGRIDLTKEK
jgi:hypothetical protein